MARRMEGTAKGCVGKRGSKRIQKPRFAHVHAQREVHGCIFDNGGVNIDSHTDPLLELVKMRIGSPKVRDIVLRGDAAFENPTIVNKCIDINYLFLFRGTHTNSARKYAKRIKTMGENKQAESGRDLCRRVQRKDIRFRSQDKE
jgi:hypothetical protein